MVVYEISPAYAGISTSSNYSQFLLEKGIVVHPTVLLSIVDHNKRIGASTRNKRVVGTLLGELIEGKVHVTSCYAVPFEEDTKDSKVIFVDKDYHKALYRMLRKVNARDRIVGWYSTEAQLSLSDSVIHSIYRESCYEPVYMMVNLCNPKSEMPAEAFISFEQPASSKELRSTFANIPLEIGSFEAEEIGVEHLMRDISNLSSSTLNRKVFGKIEGFKTLIGKVQQIILYLDDVRNGKLPPSFQIMYILQDMLNKMGRMTQNSFRDDFATELNGIYLELFIASLVKTVLVIHDLIDNRWMLKAKKAES